MSAPENVVVPHRYLALDSLRGVAALAVVLYHLGEFGWIASTPVARASWLLVDFFFVLSGFVIAASYGARLAQGFPKGRFLLLRVGRLLPLHLLIVAIFTTAEFAIMRPVLDEQHPLYLLARGLPLLDAFARHAGNFYAPVSWSISVELFMYCGAAMLFGRGKWGAAIAAALVAVAAGALLVDFNVNGFGRLIQRGLVGFPLGVLAFGLHQRFGPLLRRIPATLGEAAMLAAVGTFLWWPGKNMAWVPAIDVLFVGLVLVFARDAGLFSRLLGTAPFEAIGRWSYSIYMVHLIFIIALNRGLPPIFRAAGHPEWVEPGRHTFGLTNLALPLWAETLMTLGLLGVVLLASAWTWRHVEEPARQWSRRIAARRDAGRAEAALAAM